MNRNYRPWLWAFVVASLWACAAQAQLPAREFGNLVYPAKGNIQLDEGTLDVWIICNFDSEWDTKLQHDWAILLDIQFPDEKWHYPLRFVSWGHSLAFTGYTKPEQQYVWGGYVVWKPDEVHHVVLTWSGRKRSLFVDGTCERTNPKGEHSVASDILVEGVIRGDLTNARLEVGADSSHLTMDEIQILRIALTPDEVARAKDAPLVADANTLLLDHCDGGPAEIITGPTGGTLSGKYKIVDGKFGKAIQLWTEK